MRRQPKLTRTAAVSLMRFAGTSLNGADAARRQQLERPEADDPARPAGAGMDGGLQPLHRRFPARGLRGLFCSSTSCSMCLSMA
jgi:hypothetical protein